MTVKELEVEFRSLQSQFVDHNSKIDNLLKNYENLGEKYKKSKLKKICVRIVKKILKV